jgi:biopolymer transport protein ExbB
MQFNFIEIFQHMGVPAMVVAAVLVTMGLASLTVFAERVITLRRSRATSRAFATAVGSQMDRGEFDEVLTEAEKHQQGHLPRVVRSALATYRHAEQTADVTGLTPVERTVRHMERYMQEIGTDLRRGLAVLATVGSVAPFVGLLGTVLGIITAFQGIASTGSGGLSGVSAGISEALIETALGLAVAIPAVLAFNYLSGQIAQDELMLNHASGQLLDTLEDWAERKVASANRGSRTAAAPARPERAEHGAGLAAIASAEGVA